MRSKNYVEAFEKALAFSNEDDQMDFISETIHLTIMDEVFALMEKRGLNKADLARSLKTTPSYVTQLFAGDKLVNMKLLARLQVALNVKWDVKVQEKHNHIRFPKIKIHPSHSLSGFSTMGVRWTQIEKLRLEQEEPNMAVAS